MKSLRGRMIMAIIIVALGITAAIEAEAGPGTIPIRSIDVGGSISRPITVISGDVNIYGGLVNSGITGNEILTVTNIEIERTEIVGHVIARIVTSPAVVRPTIGIISSKGIAVGAGIDRIIDLTHTAIS